MATKIYQAIQRSAESDGERGKLTLEVWSPTPWIIDFNDYPANSREWFELFEWCEDELGSESHPIFGKVGVWHRGNVTINGYTWWGFASEDLMQRFVDRAPDRVRPNTPEGET